MAARRYHRLVRVVHPVVSELTTLRLAAGVSQQQLARLAGVPQATISDSERGLSSPTLDTLSKLAAHFAMQVTLVPAAPVEVEVGDA